MSFANLGPVHQFPDLAAIYGAIIYHCDVVVLEGRENLTTKKFKGGTLYAVDHEGIRYVEQNQQLKSAYAERAREGAKIVWVIRLKGNEHLGVIEDGVVHMKPKTRSA